MTSKELDFGLDISKFIPFIFSGLAGLLSSLALHLILDFKFILYLINLVVLSAFVIVIMEIVSFFSYLKSNDFSSLEVSQFLMLLVTFNGLALFLVASLGFELLGG